MINPASAVLVLHLTLGCTAACGHCTLESCPEKVGIDLTREEIAQAVLTASRNGIKCMELTGGEPFLRQDLMQYALREAETHGLSVFTATNAFWASDAGAARGALSGLRALWSIQFSADSYHQAFVPLERVKMGVSVAVDMGFDVQVSVTDNRAGRASTLAGLGELARYASVNPAMTIHNTQPPARLGRGKSLPDTDCLFDGGAVAPMECSHYERHSALVSVFPGRRVSYCCGYANPRLTWQYKADPNWLGRMLDVWAGDTAVNYLWNRGLASCWAWYTGQELAERETYLIRSQPCPYCFKCLPRMFPRGDMVDIREVNYGKAPAP